jgi:hypothetical protein
MISNQLLSSNAQVAYMGTHSKIFEPALGGLLAIIIQEKPQYSKYLFNKLTLLTSILVFVLSLFFLWNVKE